MNIAVLEDVNLDGVPDFAIADPGFAALNSTPRELGERGVVWIVSGADNQVLSRLYSPQLDDAFGWSLSAAGDVTGDGVDDLLVGTRVRGPQHPGVVYLYSGASGELVWDFHADGRGLAFGLDVCGGEDISGDGVPDILISTQDEARRQGATTLVIAYSGADGRVLREFTAFTSVRPHSQVIGWCGDIDHDEVPDVYCVPSDLESGRQTVFVFSGASGAMISSIRMGRGWFSGVATLELGGDACVLTNGLPRRTVSASTGVSRPELAELYAGFATSITDLDGDGVREIVKSDSGWGLAQGKLQAVSTKSGKVMYEVIPRSNGWHFGERVLCLGDVSGDGIDDLLVSGAFVASRSSAVVWIVSGKEGEILTELERGESDAVRSILK